MRVVVLGSGGSAGVPLIGGADGAGDWGACDPAEPRNRRTRAAIVIEHQGTRLLVDTPPDLRQQLLECRIPRVDGILFTHAHADHITGIDDVRILNRIADRPLDAYADAATLDELRLRFDYVFRPWTPPGFFRPVLEPRVVVPGPTLAAGLRLVVFEQDHGFVRTLGLRLEGFAYSTDVVGLSESALRTLEGVDTWLVGCFQRAKHTTHANLEQVLDWASRIGARRTILTHMGPDMDWAWLTANLPDGVEPSYDGMSIFI